MEKQFPGFYGIRPGTVEEFTPSIYDGLPEAERPVFSLLAMTVTEKQNFYDTFWEAVEVPGDGDGTPRARMIKGKRAEAVESLIVPHLTGIKNWMVPFTTAAGIYWSLDLKLRGILYDRLTSGANVTPAESTAVKS